MFEYSSESGGGMMSLKIGKRSSFFDRLPIIIITLVTWGLLMSCRSPLMIPVTSSETPTPTPLPPDQGTIPVIVKDENGQQFSAGVVIRLSDSTYVDDPDNGGVRIINCVAPQMISAWHIGYFVEFTPCDGRTTQYEIQLRPLKSVDNTGYNWLTAGSNCINCHSGQVNPSYNEYNEWVRSGHATTLNDKFFETMYRGTNIFSESSPITERRLTDKGLVRVPPEQGLTYRGPGYKLDFPQSPGTCAYCHAPAAVNHSKMEVDLTTFFSRWGDASNEGITCDVCHKILNVILADNGLPYVDRPGVLSIEYLRPSINSFYIGPFSNINLGGRTNKEHELSCLPIYSQSEFCASCHYGKFGDMVIYNSFGEWKTSKYGDNPNEPDYKTCQDCHMSHMPVEVENPLTQKRQACSESADGFQNFDHNLMDYGWDEKLQLEIPRMIRNAAKINLDFKYEPDKKESLDVIVKVRNTRAGHKFPTDSPLRHLILVINATDQFGTSLYQVDGGVIPNWGGVGQPHMEQLGMKNYGGLPGKIFANILVEEDTNVAPTAAYWNNTTLTWVNHEQPKSNSDTRLEPDKVDNSKYSFFIPSTGPIKIRATLVYRFAFFDLMDQKEWIRPDIIVTSVECIGNPTNISTITCQQVEP